MKPLYLIFALALILSMTFIYADELGTSIKIPDEPLEDQAGWKIDNRYNFDSKIDLGKAEIYDTLLWLIPLGKIEDVTLKSNTYTCGQYCSAEKEITTYKDTVLIDSIRFETILENGKRVNQDIRNYKFEIRTSHKA